MKKTKIRRIRQMLGLTTMIALIFGLDTAMLPRTVFAEVTGTFVMTGGSIGTDYTYENDTLTIKTGTPLRISKDDSSTSTHERIVIVKDVNANITLAGVNIEANGYNPALEIAGDQYGGSKGNVTISLEEGTQNILKGGKDAAGLQKNGDGEVGTLTIQGNGSLEATGNENGAGIGGGGMYLSPNRNASNIKILGGYITAKGGMNGAGIGAGRGGKASNIEISGGVINAIGTDGAAIGGGYNQEEQWTNGADGITINGGTVSASASEDGAGIGGGQRQTASNIFINGGSVKVTSRYGTDIGSGAWYNHELQPVTPKNSNSQDLLLLEIANPDKKDVKIDNNPHTPNNHSAIDGDTNLYLYLSKSNHTISIGDKQHNYKYENNQFVPDGTVSLTNPVTLRIDSVSREWEVSYDDGDSWNRVLDDNGNPVKATGNNGTTPQLKIDENNNWCVSYDDGITWQSLGVPATGAPGIPGASGKDGVSITNVEKTSTSDLVDTYTITYSDGNTSIFTVTNGSNGDKGDKGDKGDRGDKGEKGDTGEKGDKGDTGAPGIDGKNGSNGTNGINGINGLNGSDGKDGINGINGKDGINGKNGADGVGISSIEKTSSDGNVDTYTITMTDGSTSAFTVTNGMNALIRINEETNELEFSNDNGNTWTSYEIKMNGSGTVSQTVSNSKDHNLVVTALVIAGISLAGNIAMGISMFLRKKKV